MVLVSASELVPVTVAVILPVPAGSITTLVTYCDAIVAGRPAEALLFGRTPEDWTDSETAVRAMSMAEIASVTLERMM